MATQEPPVIIPCRWMFHTAVEAGASKTIRSMQVDPCRLLYRMGDCTTVPFQCLGQTRGVVLQHVAANENAVLHSAVKAVGESL